MNLISKLTAAVVLLTIALSATAQTRSLPVIFIDTEGAQPIVSKDIKLPASLRIEANDPDVATSEAIPLTVSGRGNYTWIGFEKKPYKLKFDEKTSLFGLPKSKHYALLAHADDDLAFLRNAMGFELSRRLGLEWTPTQIPVELVLNGTYKGLYFLCETIKVDPNRVNVTQQDDLATTDVSGGWLVEIDNYDSDPHISVAEPGAGLINFTYKSPEELSPLQENFLTEQMTALNDAIYAADKASTDWETLLDIDQAARFYLVQEILDDCESFHGSCYLHRQRGENEKWKFGPVWDFGNSFRRSDKNWIWERPQFHQVWIGELCKFPRFQERVKAIWDEFLQSGTDFIGQFVLDYADAIRSAAAADALLWPDYGNADIDARAAEFTSRIENSIRWLNARIGKPADAPIVYLRGEFNEWGLSHPMKTQDGNIYSISLPSLSGEFKVADDAWNDINFGSNGDALIPGATYSLEFFAPNIKASRDLTDCTVTFNLADRTLLITDALTSGVVSTVNPLPVIRNRTVYFPGRIEVFDAAGIKIAEGCDEVSIAYPGLFIIKTETLSIKHLFR